MSPFMRRFEFSTEHGPVMLTLPVPTDAATTADIIEWLSLVQRTIQRQASAYSCAAAAEAASPDTPQERA